MKPQKGDIWKISENLITYHFLIVDDGYAPPWEEDYRSYNAIHLESGELDTVFYKENEGFIKVS